MAVQSDFNSNPNPNPNLETQLDKIKLFCDEHSKPYYNVPLNQVAKIYDILFNNIIPDHTNEYECVYGGILAYGVKNYSIAEKYWNMLVEKNNIYCIESLAQLHYNLKDYAQSQKYYQLGLTNSNKFIESNYNDLFEFYIGTKNIKAYDLYLKYRHLYDNLPKKLKQQFMENYPYVLNIIIAKITNDECSICKENKTLYKFYCDHYFCDTCYIRIKKCAICRFDISLV